MTVRTNWQQVPMGQLTDHILTTHHAFLHRQVPLIAALLLDHVRQSWMKHPEFLAAHALFHNVQAELEQHLIQEETAGFPLIHAHDTDPTVRLDPFANTLDQHLAAHAHVMDLLRQVRERLWNYVAPADLGSEVAFTFGQLQQLEADLREHIHLENDVLFPRVRAIGS